MGLKTLEQTATEQQDCQSKCVGSRDDTPAQTQKRTDQPFPERKSQQWPPDIGDGRGQKAWHAAKANADNSSAYFADGRFKSALQICPEEDLLAQIASE